MAQASYFDTARRLASFLAKKPRFVTTSKVRSCHKACDTVLDAANLGPERVYKLKFGYMQHREIAK